jgi:hypothetical protein
MGSSPASSCFDSDSDRGRSSNRFTHYEIRHEPELVRNELAAAAHTLRKRGD